VLNFILQALFQSAEHTYCMRKGRIRSRIQIREDQKHADPADPIPDPDPQHYLAHDEAAEDLVEGVLVVQRAEDEALQARLLHQDRVRQRLLALEGHRLSEKRFKLKHFVFNKKK
jgi:hypothetical protein